MPFDATTKQTTDLFWYSNIELGPGRYTRNEVTPTYWTMGLTRQVLGQVDLRGKKCLDVGAADGFLATVMARSGAGRVVAVDCCEFSRQVAEVQEAYGVAFEYLPRVGSLKLLDRLIDLHKFGDRKLIEDGRHEHDFGFDVVVCSGVLYHVYSPLHLIGALRSLVRPGGLVVLETAIIPDERHYLNYNHIGDGRYIYAESDTWFITPPLLDYLLRKFCLQPLDVVYRHDKDIGPGKPVGRAAVMCRAVETVPALAAEYQLEASTRNFEYDELFKVELERLKRRVEVAYSPLIGPEHRRTVSGWEHLDLLGAIRAQEGFPIPYEFARLWLSDVG